MIINSSAVGMTANATQRTKYTQRNETLMSNLMTGERQYSAKQFAATYESKAMEKKYQENSRTETDSDRASGTKKQAWTRTAETGVPLSGIQPSQRYIQPIGAKLTSSRQDISEQLRNFLFNFKNRLTLMIGRRNPIYGRYGFGSMLDLSSGMGSYSIWRRTEYNSYTYEEQDSMSFETVGKAVTADGREISFQLQLEMSREYVETTESLTNDTMLVMTDPLVISLSSNPVSVSDQKWSFDIDGDGVKDNISLLSKGSGFLVYDKNQDGIINDGTEMFGAATGNGFSELADYDEDGNGWIDEADAIYSKLSVWLKDDAGNDKLVGLKDADVGAIYLGSASTEFALKSEKDNQYNAQVRRSGIYLSESGNARTIQQLDMVNALIS